MPFQNIAIILDGEFGLPGKWQNGCNAKIGRKSSGPPSTTCGSPISSIRREAMKIIQRIGKAFGVFRPNRIAPTNDILKIKHVASPGKMMRAPTEPHDELRQQSPRWPKIHWATSARRQAIRRFPQPPFAFHKNRHKRIWVDGSKASSCLGHAAMLRRIQLAISDNARQPQQPVDRDFASNRVSCFPFSFVVARLAKKNFEVGP